MKKILVFGNKDNVLYNFRFELIKHLNDKGYEVVLVCPYGKKIDFFTCLGMRNIHVDVDRRGTNLLKDINLYRTYKKILKAEKPDLALTFTTKTSIYAGYACKKLGIPYIVNNSGLISAKGLFRRLMDFLYKKSYSGSSCLMFQNSEEKDYFLRLIKKPIKHREIPGSGVNLEKFSFSEYPNGTGKIVFNFVARIVGFKGIDEYLECAKRIHRKHSNTVFRVFGDFDDFSYEPKIRELEEKGIVEYKGVVFDMKPWIAESYAAIHPSHYEGMTNVILEHSAMGRPCIGSDISGVKEGIENGKTGYLFKMGDVEDLVDTVEKFINLSAEEKAAMGKNARDKMVKQFSREIVINTYEEEINRIMGERYGL